MSISTFKLGNRAQYEGPHQGFRGKQGIIVSVDEMNDEDTYLIKVDNPIEQYGEVVRTYPF